MCYRKEFDFNVLFFHLRTRKVELNWTRAIRPVIAKSLRFSKIAKKMNIDLCYLFLIERKHCSY